MTIRSISLVLGEDIHEHRRKILKNRLYRHNHVLRDTISCIVGGTFGYSPACSRSNMFNNTFSFTSYSIWSSWLNGPGVGI